MFMKKYLFFFMVLLNHKSWANLAINSFWNATYNPVFSIQDAKAAFCALENKYWITEWNNKAVGINFQKKEKYLLFQFEQKGNSKFAQNRISCAFSKVLSPKLAMGLGGQIVYFHQAEFPTFNAHFKPFWGLSFTLNEDHIFYCSLSNQDFSSNRSEIPDQLNTQWRYSIIEVFSSVISIETGFYRPFTFRVFGILQPLPSLNLCLEINSSESPIQFITNWKTKHLEYQLLNGYHQKMGVSNQLGIAYLW